MLITSREPLRIAGERVHRLAPLECPPVKADITADEAKAYAAVQLFVERATASVDGFALDDASAPAVSEICRRLDGIPLAIELAAARVEFFGVAALASRLDNMFAVLTQGRRFALPTASDAARDAGLGLQSAVTNRADRPASHRDIPGDVYVGSRRSRLSSVPAVSVENAIDAMANLVAKSLLSADSTGDGTVQYRLLEATRLYATEKLAASDEGPRKPHGGMPTTI